MWSQCKHIKLHIFGTLQSAILPEVLKLSLYIVICTVILSDHLCHVQYYCYPFRDVRNLKTLQIKFSSILHG